MLSKFRGVPRNLTGAFGDVLKIRMFASAPTKSFKTVDGCTAVTHVAYGLSDAAFIFPITPSSPIAELAEQWSDLGVKNAFGDVVKVTQMQSEAGAAGALHGALVTGSLATTFTASQGLLLMIPNMYKISGELLPCVIHVAARAIASQALSIFGDHQDVMAARQTGFAFLCANTVQECQDMALVSHLATLRSRVPFVHFFDGFRVSHNIEKAQLVPYADMKKLLDFDALHAHHSRALNPMHPHIRGSNQNPDVYFQMLEASNSAYDQVPRIVMEEMDKLAKLTGRKYSLFDYSGAPDATDVLVVMGSGGSVVEETLPFLLGRGDKVGVLKPKLFRPWSAEHFLAALPPTVKRLAVLDRTKEPGSLGEPLYLDVASTLKGDPRGSAIEVIGGRWGLGQKDFTPGCVVAVVDNLKASAPKRRFTVGIEDDVTNLSLPVTVEPDVTQGSHVTECLIYGFGSDGTVGANKNAIKILGDNTDMFVQAYFAYGSQKAGGLTLSHLRFGPDPIKSYYHVSKADYVACHNNVYVDMYRMADKLKEGGVFCLNSPWTSLELLEKNLPESLKRTLFDKKAKLFNIDAFSIAENAGMGRMINVAMSAAFFKLSNVIEYEKAIELFKGAIKKSYSHRGESIVAKNYKMVDETVEKIQKIEIPSSWGLYDKAAPLKTELQFNNPSNSEFVREIQGNINLLRGDEIPVSTLMDTSLGGIMPMGTSAKEKRGVALEVPEVDMNKCTQCNYCAVSCPHAVIRPFLLSQAELDAAPAAFDSRKAKGGTEVAGLNFRIQVSPYDCTGCAVCVNTCPDDALRMVPLADIHTTSSANWEFAMGLADRSDRFDKFSLKGSQFQVPLIEFSGACAGCGETPYIKLLTQLFGNRMVIANATGCSSIYGAPFGSAPYSTLKDKTGPAWGNSLFEDAAEYGLGMSVTVALRRKALRTRVQELLMENTDAPISPELYSQLSEWNENWREPKVCDRLARTLPALLEAEKGSNILVKEIAAMADLLPKISVWNIGGDGWAFDIGYGGLDHVLASGQDVNILVLDTEVYSNTGGQASKSSPIGAIAKFAASGRPNNKKSMADMAMAYGNVYVANCSMGANMQQTLKSFIEAEAYPGPSLILAYSPCIEHKNVDGMSHTMQHMAVAANSGYYPLFRYNPLLKKEGKAPFIMDTKKITTDVSKVIESEMRYGAMKKRDVEKYEKNLADLRAWVNERFEHLKQLSEVVPNQGTKAEIAASADKEDRRPLTILYGSETGNTQELAYRTGELAKQRGFDVLIKELDEVPVESLGEHANLLIMCSTCGEGDIPRNAQSFMESLEKLTTDPSAEKPALGNVNYSVFAMGDSSYHEFCKVGKDIDNLLGQLGAQRALSMGIGNDRDEDKFETGFEQWTPQFWTVQKAPEPAVSGPPESAFEIISLGDDSVRAPYKAITAPGAVLANVDLCARLTPADYNRDIRHVQIALEKDQDLPYMLGDVLNLFPRNSGDRVQSFLKSYGEDASEMIKLSPVPGANMDARKRTASLRPRSVEQVFTEVLDIFGRPNRGFYKTLARFAADGSSAKRELEVLADDSAEGKKMYSEITAEALTYADVLLKYMHEARPSIEHLITIIPPVKPRLYSIASSPRLVGPNLVELVIVINEWKTPSGQMRTGTGTNYVRALNKGDEVACTITSGTFKFPESPMTPMIMAGLGTGLAPFRAFVQERKWMQNKGLKTGPMWLFYGCRYKAKDYIFGDELENYANEGVITELHPAFSRDGANKVYVQNKINDNQRRVYEDLIEKNGFFYLCGQAGQAELDIKAAIYRSIATSLGVSRDEAEKKFEEIAEEGRYCPELY
jgi:homodimeric pyruvate:ferredoxin (flavodoxin) oxidoreductase